MGYREQARSHNGVVRAFVFAAMELAPLLLIPEYPLSKCQKNAGRQRE